MSEVKWHGDDRAGAEARAREIGGVVVWSWSPQPIGSRSCEWGYWSREDLGPSRLHHGERVVSDYREVRP